MNFVIRVRKVGLKLIKQKDDKEKKELSSSISSIYGCKTDLNLKEPFFKKKKFLIKPI